jgi:hypothetical protein
MPDFRVIRGTVLIGTLTGTGRDMLWWEGTFEQAAEFEAIRPLFERERMLLDADQIDEWGAAWKELSKGLRTPHSSGAITVQKVGER